MKELLYLKNRKDIDGLRGLAILLVLGFHTFPEFLPGGFIGVDVFYIISGFLISSLMFKALAENKFSFSNFYARRVKRLFPALSRVLIVSYIIGWFILTNTEFMNLGKQLLASSVFMNNLLLWKQANSYFGGELFANPLLQPMLHLWSLGIEEQFYLIWPPLVWLVWGKPRLLLHLLVIGLVGSFFLCLYWSYVHPDAAFYSPMTRFWEPLLGALLAYISYYNPLGVGKKISNSMLVYLNTAQSIVGFILIIVAVLIISPHKAFPGWVALLPTIGAYLMIQAGQTALVNRLCLSNPIMIWFGKISYPLYLWHWPILSFVFLYHFEEPTLIVRSLCMTLSIILAWATYNYVEKPIRTSAIKTWIPVVLCSVMIAIGIVGFITYKNKGFPNRLPSLFHYQKVDAQWRVDTCFEEDNPINIKNCVSPGTGNLVALWGDSSAGGIYPGLKYLQQQKYFRIAQFTSAGCPPILDFTMGLKESCRPFINKTFEAIKDLKPDIVLLNSSWGYDLQSFSQLRKTVQALKQAGIKKIIIIGSPPNRFYALENILFHKYYLKDKVIPLYSNDFLQPIFIDRDPLLAKLAKEEGVEYISLLKLMCTEEGCLTVLKNKEGNYELTSPDRMHLSPIASVWVMESIRGVIN